MLTNKANIVKREKSPCSFCDSELALGLYISGMGEVIILLTNKLDNTGL